MPAAGSRRQSDQAEWMVREVFVTRAGGEVQKGAQLRNLCATASLGAYHLPPLGAGFFMLDPATLGAIREGKR